MFKYEKDVQLALSQRNHSIAKFWLTDADSRIRLEPTIIGKRVIIIDAEDTFTEMLAHQLAAIGFNVIVRSCLNIIDLDEKWDMFVMGPGPGDPRNISDERITKLHSLLKVLLSEKRPFLAVCLSHQILCLQLGMELVRRAIPNQGVQKEIDLFGKNEIVGFYNSYVAKCSKNAIQYGNKDLNIIEVSRDYKSREVYGLKGEHFVSLQFHPESLLTQNGIDIIARSVKGILS
jgi:phenazine biosynthesis protein phzE